MKVPTFQEYTHSQSSHPNAQPGTRIHEKIPDEEVLLDNSSSSEDSDHDIEADSDHDNQSESNHPIQTESDHEIQTDMTYESWTPQQIFQDYAKVIKDRKDRWECSGGPCEIM